MSTTKVDIPNSLCYNDAMKKNMTIALSVVILAIGGVLVLNQPQDTAEVPTNNKVEKKVANIEVVKAEKAIEEPTEPVEQVEEISVAPTPAPEVNKPQTVDEPDFNVEQVRVAPSLYTHSYLKERYPTTYRDNWVMPIIRAYDLAGNFDDRVKIFEIIISIYKENPEHMDNLVEKVRERL